MELKSSIFVLMVLAGTSDCGLLRTPKVYNALITSNENFTPSRAYPVIQPTLHETGIAFPQFPLNGYGSFGLFDPYAQSQFYNAGRSIPRSQLQQQEPNQPQGIQSAQSVQPIEIEPKRQEAQEAADDQVSSEKQVGIEEKPAEHPQIPLNEFGLPPSLIPISSIGNQQQQAVPLQPYPYSTYPLIFDQYGGFQTGPYLPPFGYYPQPGFGYPTKEKKIQDVPQLENNRMEKELSRSPVAPLTVDPEVIKNHPNKNKNIPDVPPPPIPTGKRTASAAKQ